MKNNSETGTFEDKLSRLEEISVMLENENIGLDEALNLYEEGIKLSKVCMDALKNAELKITELRKQIDVFSPSADDQFDE